VYAFCLSNQVRVHLRIRSPRVFSAALTRACCLRAGANRVAIATTDGAIAILAATLRAEEAGPPVIAADTLANLSIDGKLAHILARAHFAVAGVSSGVLWGRWFRGYRAFVHEVAHCVRRNACERLFHGAELCARCVFSCFFLTHELSHACAEAASAAICATDGALASIVALLRAPDAKARSASLELRSCLAVDGEQRRGCCRATLLPDFCLKVNCVLCHTFIRAPCCLCFVLLCSCE
jgi:hypothetical protein